MGLYRIMKKYDFQKEWTVVCSIKAKNIEKASDIAREKVYGSPNRGGIIGWSRVRDKRGRWHTRRKFWYSDLSVLIITIARGE